MFKKSLFAAFGLAMALALATPEKAHAGVAIGVTVGAPVVVRPAYRPYVYVPPAYPPVVYARPYWYGGPAVYGAYDCNRPYWRHEGFERREWREHEWRERHWDYRNRR